MAQLFALPFAITCWLESAFSAKSEIIFTFWAHVFASLPGLPGVFLRRGFYSLVLQKCSTNCHIGFGSFFSHRQSIVEDNVYMGNYCMVGSAHLKQNCLIGSRASLLSGTEQHTRNEKTGSWEAFSKDNQQQITIGANTWIGEGAVIMANTGIGCQIGAGTVLSTPTGDYVVMAGNPARFIKKLAEIPSIETITENSVHANTAIK